MPDAISPLADSSYITYDFSCAANVWKLSLLHRELLYRIIISKRLDKITGQMSHRSTIFLLIKSISLAILILFTTSISASEISEWSDKTICRLTDENHSKVKEYSQEATKRGLICKSGKVSGYTQANLTLSKPISSETVSKEKHSLCSSGAYYCNELELCEWATTKGNDGTLFWKQKPNHYVTRAKKMRLNCAEVTYSVTDNIEISGYPSTPTIEPESKIVYATKTSKPTKKKVNDNVQTSAPKLTKKKVNDNVQTSAPKLTKKKVNDNVQTSAPKLTKKKVNDNVQTSTLEVNVRKKDLTPSGTKTQSKKQHDNFDLVTLLIIAVGCLVIVKFITSNRKKVILPHETNTERPKVDRDDPSLEELLEIDTAWPNVMVKGHLQTESEKWTNRLVTMADGPEKESAQNMLDLVAKARKKYE